MLRRLAVAEGAIEVVAPDCEIGDVDHVVSIAICLEFAGAPEGTFPGVVVDESPGCNHPEAALGTVPQAKR